MTDSGKRRVTTSELTREILEIVRHARAGAYRSVNAVMGEAYWQIGRRIVKEEQRYPTYPPEGILYTLRRELSWSHHRLIMRVENPQAREFYMGEAADWHWSTRQPFKELAYGE